MNEMNTPKIDRRKKYFLVLDTETANGLDDPFVYDLGFVVADRKGNIYERHSYIIYDIFVACRDLRSKQKPVDWYNFPPRRR